MKTLKLNVLSTSQIETRELQHVMGGAACGCGCTSNSTMANGNANHDGGGLYSPGLHTNQTIFLDEVVVTANR